MLLCRPNATRASSLLLLLYNVCLILLVAQCGSTPITSGGSNRLTEPVYVAAEGLVVGLPTGQATTINCAGVKHAFIVKQGTLTLQNVRLFGCSQQAILIRGPAAKLVANRVTFTGHGSTTSAAEGLVISAHQADVVLTAVTITDNKARLSALGIAPAFQLSCDNVSALEQPKPPACDAPILRSSLIALHRSSLRLSNSHLAHNTADTIIYTAGSAPQSLHLEQGTTVVHNTATWLLVADALMHDTRGRANLLAPHPNPPDPLKPAVLTNFKPAYTAYDFIGKVRKLDLSQLASAAQLLKTEQFVGVAPRSQAPLQLQIKDVSISGNTVQGGLLWLRLVNTTLQGVNITGNAAITSAPATASLQAATAAAALLKRGDAQALDEKAWPALSPCRTYAQLNALIRVHGPAGFDMHRCNVDGNIHPVGGLLRVTDGMGLTSIRSSSLSNNTVAAVLRFEGRTWMTDVAEFYTTTQYLDVGRFSQMPNTGKDLYKKRQDEKLVKMDTKFNASQDASLYVRGCRLSGNKVFHGVVLIKGHKQEWQEYEANYRAALRNSKESREDSPGLKVYTASWFVVDSRLDENHLLVAPPLSGDASGVRQLGMVLSAAPKDIRTWADNNTLCQQAVDKDVKSAANKDFRLQSAVLSTFACSGMMSVEASSNTGFESVISQHSTLVTMGAQLSDNHAIGNILRVIYSDIWVYNMRARGNTVAGGNIVSMEAFEGIAKEVHLLDNTMLNRTREAPAAAAAAGAAPVAKTAIWRVHQARALNISNITISGTRGPSEGPESVGFALDMSEYALEEPLTNAVIKGNVASGVRMMTTIPSYNDEDVVVERCEISDNTITEEAGGLVLGRFTSAVGTRMTIVVKDSKITNNKRATGQRLLQLVRGGGVAFKGPGEELTSNDLTAAFGQLKELRFSVIHTHIEGNSADEGAGVWSAWPVTISSCNITGNSATRAGGGVFLKLSDGNGLAGKHASLIQDATISHNRAGFGGGLACDGCRLVVNASSIAFNQAETDVPAAPGISHCIDINATNSTNSTIRAAGANSRVAMRNSSCTTLTSGSPQLPGATSANPLMSIIPGAGGAIGASLTRSSFIAVCGSGSRADLSSNHAASVGGLVFMSSNQTNCSSTECPAASWSPCAAASTVAAGADSGGQRDGVCGVQLKDVDWANTTAGTKGQLLAWAGPAVGSTPRAFRMMCSTNSSRSSKKSSRRDSSSSSSCGCDEDFAASMWQLPNILSVYNSTCLTPRQDRNQAAGRGTPSAWRQCAVSNSSLRTTGADVPPPRVVAGYQVNFTVYLGDHETHASQRPALGSKPAVNSSLGAVILQQPDDGQLFVIGGRSAEFNQQGAANFTNMTLQPISPPTFNRNYTFSFAANFSSSPLLVSVQPASVTIEVLRCTMGQRMTVNRCVPCADSGTFSLNPNESCQPCVLGGSCRWGMLLPADGYFMHNPFVPQVLPCPLIGACVNFPMKQGHHLKVASRGRRGLTAAGPGRQGDVTRGGLSTDSYRNESLLQFVQQLAHNMTQDPIQEAPLLLDVRYRDILDNWQGLQCAAGYKGFMCGTCDPHYVDTANGATTPTRYALFLNRCVSCAKDPAATLALLVVFFILFFLYICMGIAFHVKAQNRSFLHLQSFDHSANQQPRQSAANSTQSPQHLETEAATPGVVLELVGVTPGGSASRASAPRSISRAGAGAPPGQASDPNTRQQALPAVTGPPQVQGHCPEQGQAGRELLEAGGQVGAPGGVAETQGQQQPGCNRPCEDTVSELAGAGAAATTTAGRRPHTRQNRRRPSTGAQMSSEMATLVAIWKVLTSYIQILSMVRYLPFMRQGNGGSALTFVDVSTFTQFLAFDCILPGPTDKLAITRILLSAFGVPLLLFAAFLVLWLALWGLHQAGAALHTQLSSSGASGWSVSRRSSQACSSSLSPFQVLSSDSGTTSISTAGQSATIPTLPSVAAAAADAPASKPETSRPPAAAATRSMSWSFLNRTGSSRNSNSTSGKLSWELPTAVSTFMQRLPSSTISGLEKVGANRPPIHLRHYLPLRLLITAGILGYSCYSLFTSNMLLILACQPITAVTGAAPAGSEAGENAGTSAVAAGVYDATPGLISSYGAAHYAWLQKRYEHTRDEADLPELCHPTSVAGGVSCQVSGKYWKQDYSMECYTGAHEWLTWLGAVMLAVVGFIVPVVLGVLLWLNRSNLKESAFAIKYSFFYREYEDRVCYWEFIIMGRKLAFLAIFLAFIPELLIKETATMLQLQLAVMLAVILLVLHERLRPYREDLLNTLEKSALVALTLSFLLLACAVAVDTHANKRIALLVLTCVLNFLLLLYFVWHMGKLLWKLFGNRVLRCVQHRSCRRPSRTVRRIQRFVSAHLPRSVARLCSTMGRGQTSGSQVGMRV